MYTSAVSPLCPTIPFQLSQNTSKGISEGKSNTLKLSKFNKFDRIASLLIQKNILDQSLWWSATSSLEFPSLSKEVLIELVTYLTKTYVAKDRSGRNGSVQFSLVELYTHLKNCGLSASKIQIVGGGAFYFLSPMLLLLLKTLGIEDPGNELKEEIDRWKEPPGDLDIRFWTKDFETACAMSEAVVDFLASKMNDSTPPHILSKNKNYIKEHCLLNFHKEASKDPKGNAYTTVSLGEGYTKNIDLLFVSHLKLENLSISDWLQIPVASLLHEIIIRRRGDSDSLIKDIKEGKFFLNILPTSGTNLWQVFLERFLRVFRIPEIKVVEKGWIEILSAYTKGRRALEAGIVSELFKKLEAENNKATLGEFVTSILQKYLKSHYRVSETAAFALTFNACLSLESELGKKVWEGMFSQFQNSTSPLIQRICKLIQEGASFREISALMQLEGIFLLSHITVGEGYSASLLLHERELALQISLEREFLLLPFKIENSINFLLGSKCNAILEYIDDLRGRLSVPSYPSSLEEGEEEVCRGAESCFLHKDLRWNLLGASLALLSQSKIAFLPVGKSKQWEWIRALVHTCDPKLLSYAAQIIEKITCSDQELGNLAIDFAQPRFDVAMKILKKLVQKKNLQIEIEPTLFQVLSLCKIGIDGYSLVEGMDTLFSLDRKASWASYRIFSILKDYFYLFENAPAKSTLRYCSLIMKFLRKLSREHIPTEFFQKIFSFIAENSVDDQDFLCCIFTARNMNQAMELQPLLLKFRNRLADGNCLSPESQVYLFHAFTFTTQNDLIPSSLKELKNDEAKKVAVSLLQRLNDHPEVYLNFYEKLQEMELSKKKRAQLIKEFEQFLKIEIHTHKKNVHASCFISKAWQSRYFVSLFEKCLAAGFTCCNDLVILEQYFAYLLKLKPDELKVESACEVVREIEKRQGCIREDLIKSLLEVFSDRLDIQAKFILLWWKKYKGKFKDKEKVLNLFHPFIQTYFSRKIPCREGEDLLYLYTFISFAPSEHDLYVNHANYIKRVIKDNEFTYPSCALHVNPEFKYLVKLGQEKKIAEPFDRMIDSCIEVFQENTGSNDLFEAIYMLKKNVSPLTRKCPEVVPRNFLKILNALAKSSISNKESFLEEINCSLVEWADSTVLLSPIVIAGLLKNREIPSAVLLIKQEYLFGKFGKDTKTYFGLITHIVDVCSEELLSFEMLENICGLFFLNSGKIEDLYFASRTEVILNWIEKILKKTKTSTLVQAAQIVKAVEKHPKNQSHGSLPKYRQLIQKILFHLSKPEFLTVWNEWKAEQSQDFLYLMGFGQIIYGDINGIVLHLEWLFEGELDEDLISILYSLFDDFIRYVDISSVARFYVLNLSRLLKAVPEDTNVVSFWWGKCWEGEIYKITSMTCEIKSFIIELFEITYPNKVWLQKKKLGISVEACLDHYKSDFAFQNQIKHVLIRHIDAVIKDGDLRNIQYELNRMSERLGRDDLVSIWIFTAEKLFQSIETLQHSTYIFTEFLKQNYDANINQENFDKAKVLLFSTLEVYLERKVDMPYWLTLMDTAFQILDSNFFATLYTSFPEHTKKFLEDFVRSSVIINIKLFNDQRKLLEKKFPDMIKMQDKFNTNGDAICTELSKYISQEFVDVFELNVVLEKIVGFYREPKVLEISWKLFLKYFNGEQSWRGQSLDIFKAWMYIIRSIENASPKFLFFLDNSDKFLDLLPDKIVRIFILEKCISAWKLLLHDTKTRADYGNKYCRFWESTKDTLIFCHNDFSMTEPLLLFNVKKSLFNIRLFTANLMIFFEVLRGKVDDIETLLKILEDGIQNDLDLIDHSHQEGLYHFITSYLKNTYDSSLEEETKSRIYDSVAKFIKNLRNCYPNILNKLIYFDVFLDVLITKHEGLFTEACFIATQELEFLTDPKILPGFCRRIMERGKNFPYRITSLPFAKLLLRISSQYSEDPFLFESWVIFYNNTKEYLDRSRLGELEYKKREFILAATSLLIVFKNQDQSANFTQEACSNLCELFFQDIHIFKDCYEFLWKSISNNIELRTSSSFKEGNKFREKKTFRILSDVIFGASSYIIPTYKNENYVSHFQIQMLVDHYQVKFLTYVINKVMEQPSLELSREFYVGIYDLLDRAISSFSLIFRIQDQPSKDLLKLLDAFLFFGFPKSQQDYEMKHRKRCQDILTGMLSGIKLNHDPCVKFQYVLVARAGSYVLTYERKLQAMTDLLHKILYPKAYTSYLMAIRLMEGCDSELMNNVISYKQCYLVLIDSLLEYRNEIEGAGELANRLASSLTSPFPEIINPFRYRKEMVWNQAKKELVQKIIPLLSAEDAQNFLVKVKALGISLEG